MGCFQEIHSVFQNKHRTRKDIQVPEGSSPTGSTLAGDSISPGKWEVNQTNMVRSNRTWSCWEPYIFQASPEISLWNGREMARICFQNRWLLDSNGYKMDAQSEVMLEKDRWLSDSKGYEMERLQNEWWLLYSNGCNMDDWWIEMVTTWMIYG